MDVSTYWEHQFKMLPTIEYGPDKQQRLDVFIQGKNVGEPEFFKATTNKKPTLIFIHGGGWIFGDKESRINYLLPYLQRGWNIVNAEYRQGKGTAPDAVTDIQNVFNWVAENADKYYFDLNNVVLSGESAGAHLALFTGFFHTLSQNSSNPIKVKAIVNWFGISDIAKEYDNFRDKMDWNFVLMWIGDPARLEEISREYSPIYFITPQTPPVLSIHGINDSMVPISQSYELHEALDKAGVPNQLLSLPGGTHSGFSENQFQLIYSTIFSFLEEKVSVKKQKDF